MEKKINYTISVYTENNVGLLHRLSAIFLKRHINIESLTTSQSEIDSISISHDAKSRKGFALGAVMCAEWIISKKGVFTMEDFLSDIKF